MNLPWTETGTIPAPPRLSRWWIFMGVFIGLLFLVAMQLPLKWFVFLFVFSLILIGSLALEKKREFLLCLLVLSVPFWIGMHIDYHKTPFGRSTFGFPIHSSFIPLAVLYLIWATRRVFWKIPAPISTRGLLPLAGLLGAGAVSVLVAGQPLFAVFDLFALATSILIFIYVASEIREIKDLRLVIVLLAGAASMQAILALAQSLTGSTLGLDFFRATRTLYGYSGLETLTRVGGLVGHPNQLALFFDLLLPLSVSLLFLPMRAGIKFLLLAAVFLEVLALGVTYSRGGIVSSILAILLILLFHWSMRIGLLRAIFAILFAAVLSLVVLLTVPNPIEKGLLRTEGTGYGRVVLAKVALNVIRHHPMFGVGLNNFVYAARQYAHTPEQLISVWNSPVHNLFLFIAGEIGLVGLTFFLIFVISALTALLPALRSPDPFFLCAGVGLLAGLLAFFGHAQVDYTIWTQNRLLWFVLGLAVSLGRIARAPLETPPAVATG